jgi:hypothetical protein
VKLGLYILMMAVGQVDANRFNGTLRRRFRPAEQAAARAVEVAVVQKDVYDHFTGEAVGGAGWDSGVRILVAPPPPSRAHLGQRRDPNKDATVEQEAWRQAGFVVPGMTGGGGLAAPLPGQQGRAPLPGHWDDNLVSTTTVVHAPPASFVLQQQQQQRFSQQQQLYTAVAAAVVPGQVRHEQIPSRRYRSRTCPQV